MARNMLRHVSPPWPSHAAPDQSSRASRHMRSRDSPVPTPAASRSAVEATASMAAVVTASAMAVKAAARALAPLCHRRHSSSVPSSAAAHAPASASRPGTGGRQLGATSWRYSRAREARPWPAAAVSAPLQALAAAMPVASQAPRDSLSRSAACAGISGSAAAIRRQAVTGRHGTRDSEPLNAYMPTTAPYALGAQSAEPRTGRADLGVSGSHDRVRQRQHAAHRKQAAEHKQAACSLPSRGEPSHAVCTKPASLRAGQR